MESHPANAGSRAAELPLSMSPALAPPALRHSDKATQKAVRLPGPPPSWELRGEAACDGITDDPFFGPDHEAPRVRAARVARACAICAHCPVRAACLDGALERGEVWGVWGGVNLERPGQLR